MSWPVAERVKSRSSSSASATFGTTFSIAVTTIWVFGSNRVKSPLPSFVTIIALPGPARGGYRARALRRGSDGSRESFFRHRRAVGEKQERQYGSDVRRAAE